MRLRILLLAVATTLLAADFAAEGKLWWAHIEYLADDRLAGRNVGTEGYEKAVAYVAGQFDKIGLKPAGTSGYLQPVKFETRQLAADQTKLALVRDGQEEAVALGQEATLSARSEIDGAFEAPMVFAGYGMTIPEGGWDDFAGLDLRGKVVVYVNAPAPAKVSGNVKSHFGSAVERWAAMKKLGAIGVAAIPNPRPPAGTNPGQGPGARDRGRARKRELAVALRAAVAVLHQLPC